MGSRPARVVMLVKNSFEFDARVRKEAATLIDAGWPVTVVALHVPGVTRRRETTPEGIDVVRVQQLWGRRPGWLGPSTATASPPTGGAHGGRAHVGRGVRRALRSLRPLFWKANRFVVDRRMVREGHRLSPAVVHAHDLNTLTAGARLARLCGSRLVYDAHEFHRARNGMSPGQARAAAVLEDRLAAVADLVVTATDAWADELQRLWDRRPVVVRNAPPARADVRPVDLHAAAGVGRDRRLLVYIGSVQQGRGIEESMAALPMLPDCDLVVIGYGAHVPELRREAQNRSVAARVHFLPPVDNREVVAWAAGADAGLCLIVNTSFSYFTSLPNKLLDYVQARVPVVASDFPEMGRVVREHGVGQVCDPADPRSVAAAVRRVVDGRCSYEAALRSAAATLTWDAEARRLIAAYAAMEAPGPVREVPLQ